MKMPVDNPQRVIKKRGPRGSYTQVSDKERREVIYRFQVKHEPLAVISKSLNIKYTTCKSIMTVFEREGRVEKFSKEEQIKRMMIAKKKNKQNLMEKNSF